MRAKWLEKGGACFYGCPLSDPKAAATSPSGTGSTTVEFPKQEQAIFVEPTSGPNKGTVLTVEGCFAKLYRLRGGTSSWIGLPVGNAFETSYGLRQNFEYGYMVWDKQTGICDTRKPGEPETVGMSLVAKDYKVAAGETVQVPIYLENGDNVANVNFTVTYNTDVARIEGMATPGNMLGASLFRGNAAEGGLFRGAFAGTTGVSGTGTVAYITFKAVGPLGSRTPLTLAVTTINQPSGGVPRIGLRHGSITIAKVGPGPGDIKRGDGGCGPADDRLTADDALCALEMSVKLKPVNLVMDMDNSGDVTSRDATLILQAIDRPQQ